MKYFPSFFGSDFCILREKTLVELRKEFLDYCESFFLRNIEEDYTKKMQIKEAYDYMRNMLEKRVRTYETKSEIARKVLESYEGLIATLANYRFKAHRETSYGANQNRTNQQILFEISLLKPMLVKVLDNINLHFTKIEDVTKVSSFDNELREKIEGLIEELEDAHRELEITETHYHKTWALAQIGGESDSYLGETKLEWKLARNNACRAILDFYREINAINMSLQPEYMVYPLEETAVLYSEGVGNIMSGPNYYSYLSKETRDNLTKQNILRKRPTSINKK